MTPATAEVCDSPAHNRAAGAEPNRAAVERASRLFRALGDEARLRLLVRLLPGECCVGDLAQSEGEALSTISQRLRVLRADNIVKKRRDGKHVNYSLSDRHVADLVSNAMSHVSEPGTASRESNYG